MRRLMIAIGVAGLLSGGCSPDADEAIKAKDGSKRSQETVVRGSDDTTERTATSTRQARQPLQVTAQGFTQLPKNSIGSSYATYAVVVKNPNADVYATGVRVNVSLLDAAGAVVGSENDTISLILPGQEAAIADTASATGVAKIDVQVLGEDWDEPEGTVGSFTTEGVVTRPEQYGGMKTTGTVASTFAKNLENVRAVAVYRNAAGAVLGGAYTYVDFVPAGGRIGFEITSLQTVPGVAATGVYIGLTSLSLLDT